MKIEEKYRGMTVNERLYVSGKIAAFDQAVLEKDVSKVKLILKEVEVDEPSIRSILQELSLIVKE